MLDYWLKIFEWNLKIMFMPVEIWLKCSSMQRNEMIKEYNENHIELEIIKYAIKSGDTIDSKEIKDLAMTFLESNDEDAFLETLRIGVEFDEMMGYILAGYISYMNKKKRLFLWDDKVESLRPKDNIFKDLSRYFWKIACFYRNNEMLEEAIYIAERAISSFQATPEVYIDLAQYYFFKTKNFENSINVLKKAIENRAVNSATYFYLYQYTNDNSYINVLKQIIADDNNTDYKAYVFLSMLFNDDKEEYYLRKMTEQLLKNNEFNNNLKNYKSASNQILIIDGEYIEESIVIKESDKKFNKEIAIRKKLEKVIKQNILNFNDFKAEHPFSEDDISEISLKRFGVSVPKYISHYKMNNKYYYIMKRVRGETLTEHISKNKGIINEYVLLLITFTIGIIYNLIDPNKFNTYDYEGKIIEKGYSEKILKAAKPIIDSFKNSKYYSYFNDSWTDNWLINVSNSKLNILLIDTEDRGKVPLALDLAHFLNCIPMETFETRLIIAKNTIKTVNYISELCNNSDKIIVNHDEFMNEYYNCVIYRALLNTISLKRRGRDHDSKQVAKTGAEMIDYMNNTNLINSKYSKQYEIIKDQLIAC